MKNSIVLCSDDRASLLTLLNHECPGPWPNPEQSATIQTILDHARVLDESSILDAYGGLGDQIALVAVDDPEDSFNMQIVLPFEADVDVDRIPVTLPISLAVLGHRIGEVVSWDTTHGTREMRIMAVIKSACTAMAG